MPGVPVRSRDHGRMLRRIVSVVARSHFCALCVGVAAAVEAPYQAPSPEPTPQETVILELINRFRADPVGEADRLMAQKNDWVFGGVDAEMFRAEMKALKPAQPLVFNLRLLDAARKHSHYMILNELGHVEDPAKGGFTGKTVGERCAAAGYPTGGGTENCFRDASSPEHSHAGFVVDRGPGGTGGMQPGRGHRTNLINPSLREIGAGAVAHGGKLSVTHDLGTGSARSVGGVVFVDADGDGAYTIGEGRGGVAITGSDGSRATSWSSGAYALPLKGGGPVTVTATYLGASARVALPGGGDNQHWCWPIAKDVEAALADKLIAACEAQKDPQAPAYAKAQVALAVGARGLVLDAERAQRIATLAGDVPARLEAARTAVASLLAGTSPPAKGAIAAQGKPFAGTAAAAWFREAETALQADQLAGDFAAKASSGQKPTASMQRALIQELEAQREAMRDGELRARVGAAIARVQAAAKY
jgi:hypothetical protein